MSRTPGAAFSRTAARARATTRPDSRMAARDSFVLISTMANYYTGIRMVGMVRTPLTPEERERGERLGLLLREARGERSMVEIAAAAGLSAETLRKIETGRAPTPAFFTVAALAGVLGLSMDELVVHCTPTPV
ncbi:hypothetical protein GCM10010275_51470 [Streptomyces litmocidini]|nr:hypothetical protein GCM10010275_51470 [Streptomyces litmocidini]